MNNEQCLELEKELAELLGYHRLMIEYGPMHNSWWRGDNPSLNVVCVDVPQWTRDNAAAFELMCEHEIAVEVFHKHVWTKATGTDKDCSYAHSYYEDKQQCVRTAIVKAVIAKLKGN